MEAVRQAHEAFQAFLSADHNVVAEQPFERSLAGVIGLSVSQLRFTLSLFASVILAGGIRLLRNPTGELHQLEPGFKAKQTQLLPPPAPASVDSLHKCALPSRILAARHLYALLTGVALVYYPFGSSVLHVLPMAAASYAALLLAPRHAGTLAWLTVFPYLIYL